MPKYIFTKNGSREIPRNVPNADYNSAAFGTSFIYEPVDVPVSCSWFLTPTDFASSDYNKFKSLKNLINAHYTVDQANTFDSLLNNEICLISINSLHLGSGIKKGTVKLNYYCTGTILSQITDRKEDGFLYDSSDKKIGLVLYNQGFVILSGSDKLSFNSEQFKNGANLPSWTYFGYFATSNIVYSSDMNYEIKNSIPTKTIFIEANKNTLNHSNNPTYIQSGSYSYNYSSSSFIESRTISIKNIVESPFTSGSANFEKETYISKIALYDKDKKVIGIASLANPIRKTENREFLFKLKLDI